MRVKVVGEGGVGDGAAKGGEVELGGGVDDIKRGLQEGVNDMDEAAGPGEVLENHRQMVWRGMGLYFGESGLTGVERVDLEPSPLVKILTLPAC